MKPAALLMALAFGLNAQTQVENAKLEIREFAGSLPSQLAQFGTGPFWAAWSEPIIAGRHGDMCWSNGNQNDHSTVAPVRLEGQVAVLVMVRVENAQVEKLQLASPDCRFDGGGVPFYWLNAVPADESVRWLKTQVTGRHPDTAILGIGLHAGPASERALDELMESAQPERVREKAALWLGNSRGAHGVEVLKRVLTSDPSEKVREQVVFALAQSTDPGGMAAVIEAAKNDKDARIRSRALFWLASKAQAQAQEVITNAVQNDPERQVKIQAVFALKQLPDNQGVPLLINVAKTHTDPEVRKKAMFWLGQSQDPRALDYFTQVLKSR
ncbi:MAG: HEAT repeat domain-containing protein [Terriglobia bacterium]